MDTRTCLRASRETDLRDYKRAVRQLRLAAAGHGQSEEHLRRIRAATRC
ncbi:hypothetical protein H7J07_04045 [Mycobacterium koreense]|nr:hypothetical protein [Mycolicibacillus koreensis]MCV7247426.1 hypothetical protein [Mycolicibacillus koreensis]